MRGFGVLALTFFGLCLQCWYFVFFGGCVAVCVLALGWEDEALMWVAGMSRRKMLFFRGGLSCAGYNIFMGRWNIQGVVCVGLLTRVWDGEVESLKLKIVIYITCHLHFLLQYAVHLIITKLIAFCKIDYLLLALNEVPIE